MGAALAAVRAREAEAAQKLVLADRRLQQAVVQEEDNIGVRTDGVICRRHEHCPQQEDDRAEVRTCSYD